MIMSSNQIFDDPLSHFSDDDDFSTSELESDLFKETTMHEELL